MILAFASMVMADAKPALLALEIGQNTIQMGLRRYWVQINMVALQNKDQTALAKALRKVSLLANSRLRIAPFQGFKTVVATLALLGPLNGVLY